MAFSLRKPAPKQIERFLDQQQARPFSYPYQGRTLTPWAAKPPTFPGYNTDHNRVQLGYGQATFAQARAAIQTWQMFNFDWVELCWPNAPIEVGSTVGVLIKALGVWSINASRIVYLTDEAGPIERYGFAYGTLPDHAEGGEERFSVAWDHADDSVWYDILAFSRPKQLLSRVGYPYIRHLQKRFAAASKAAMQQAIGS